MSMVMLVDANSIGFAAMHGGRLKVGDTETQAIFGVVRTLRMLVDSFRPSSMAVLWDGRSWRKSACAEYKANRSTNPEIVELTARYKKQRPYIARAIRHLGVPQVFATNLEADDLAGILTRRARLDEKEVLLISGDRDWLQLVQEGVRWHDPIREKLVNVHGFEEATGYVTQRAFVEGKALQGDTSDNIKGVGGIGEKGAEELLRKWGSVQDFICQVSALDEKALKKLPKKLREFATDRAKIATFARNMDLMDLASPSIPRPEKLTVTKGKLDVQAFSDLCAEFAFHSILQDLEKFLKPFVKE